MEQHKPDATLNMAVEIVSAYVSNNAVPAGDLGQFIRKVHGALAEVKSANNGPRKPAVPASKSVFPGYLVCLEDGKHLKMLKRYLRTHYGLSPAEYRAKWGLPADYPMVAPKYAAERSAFAKKIGLGQSSRPGGKRKV